MKRDFNPLEPELMDRPQPATPELENVLGELAALNRRFGGHRLLRKFLPLWFNRGRVYRVLDICTGAGDMPRVMVDWARARDITLRIDAVDANEGIIDIARRQNRDYPEIKFIHGNGLKFETDETYDLVTCSLALHHFAEEDAIILLRHCRDFSHRYVLVSDLERSWLTLLGVNALSVGFGERMTREDGRTSARRAFSYGELHALAVAAGWQDFGHARFLFCRQAIWLDLRIGGDIPLTDTAVLPCPT